MLRVERKGLSWRAPGYTQDERDPVVCVSWEYAKDYTAWVLSVRNEHFRVVTPNIFGAAPYLRTRFPRARCLRTYQSSNRPHSTSQYSQGTRVPSRPRCSPASDEVDGKASSPLFCICSRPQLAQGRSARHRSDSVRYVRYFCQGPSFEGERIPHVVHNVVRALAHGSARITREAGREEKTRATRESQDRARSNRRERHVGQSRKRAECLRLKDSADDRCTIKPTLLRASPD